MEITSWKHMLEVLNIMGEDELRETINYECSTYKRPTIIARLHSRYAKLRAKRERRQLVLGEILL